MFIEEQVRELKKISAEADRLFSPLNKHQLNWKPAAAKWSIAQVLDHIMVTNQTYYPQLNGVIKGSHKNTWYQNLRFISSFFGKMMIRDLGPSRKRTFKNPPIFSPAQSDLPEKVVTIFLKHQHQLCEYLQQLKAADLEKTVIHSPAAKFLTYNLKDAITVINVHEQRHLLQATEVLRHPGFPGK